MSTSNGFRPTLLTIIKSVFSFIHLRPTDLTRTRSISENHSSSSTPLNETNNPIKLDDDIQIEHERKIQMIMDMLHKEGEEDAVKGLAMIDAIQRLGIEYRFQDEIHAILLRHYTTPTNHDQNNLHEVALRFRLLRQEGYFVPTGVFDKFQEEGKFKEKLSCDIKGLMGLYEASQLSREDEYLLDEAGEYSYGLLNSLMVTNNLDRNQAKAVENLLKDPYYKSLPNFMAKSSLISYFKLQEGNQWINDLQEVADFEFQIVQLQHQEEKAQVSEWWKDVGLSKELKFARDQPLKWFMWSITALTDPSLSRQRVELIKPISLVYILDDIFDVRGTLQDLTFFTSVIDRWDIASIEQLPDYMRICFQALDKITNEVSNMVYEQIGWNPTKYLSMQWGSLCHAFLVEARWFSTSNLPRAEEYLENGIVSTGVHVVLVHLFFLVGEGINKENVELIEGNPGIMRSTSKILRLWDDFGSAKDENQEGNDGSYVEYYMKEHQESSRENATKHVLQMISDTWKQLNHDCLFHNPFSPTLTKACLNVARMVPSMYSYDENCSLPLLEEVMNSFVH
ncbi:(3S,6E)-nerolidol synthase 1-like [Euphorbia lathyris]|uniref:(3S,6E)-nerolidol synthase 1-like n=1 Tax=Euphorbia lathyris TaxID=212925 RepID=UPI00331322B6